MCNGGVISGNWAILLKANRQIRVRRMKMGLGLSGTEI